MSTNDDDQSATTAGPCADETEAVPPATQTAAELAWSLDDDDEDAPVEPQSWRSTGGVAAVLLASTGVIVFVIGVVGWVSVRAGADSAPAPLPAEPTVIPAAALPPITPAPMAAPAAPPTRWNGRPRHSWEPSTSLPTRWRSTVRSMRDSEARIGDRAEGFDNM